MGVKLGLFTVREEQRLKMSDKVLKNICGPRTAVITKDWRKLNDQEHHNMYSSPNIDG
jgi:hypothetical protein